MTLRPQRRMVGSSEQVIAAQAREIEMLKAARNVPNTAAADMASILDFSNTTLQSDKCNLEGKVAGLTQHIATMSHRNAFLENELTSASHLLGQSIPAEQDVKQGIATFQATLRTLKQEKIRVQQQNSTLGAKIKTLESEKLVLQQHHHNAGLQQATLLTEHAALQHICQQWSVFSANQGVEITGLKRNAEVLSGSLVRKTWRLHVQKTYLDGAGLVVKEFEVMDDEVVRQWAAENLGKTEVTVGGKGNAAAAVQVTPIEAAFSAPDAKKASENTAMK